MSLKHGDNDAYNDKVVFMFSLLKSSISINNEDCMYN